MSSMADPNALAAVAPKILAQGLMALRSTNLMASLVNRDYSDEFMSKRGLTVDVPIPSSIAVRDVVPANVAPDSGSVSPTTIPVTLDKWKEAAFDMTDRDMQQAMEGTIPMQASEAIKAIANQVNADIFAAATGVNGFTSFVGTPGTTPFAIDAAADPTGVSEATDAMRVLNIQECPVDENRRIVLDPTAQAAALGLRAFQDASWSATAEAIMNGTITRRLGFGWFMDQQVPNTPTSPDDVSGLMTMGAAAAGATSIDIDGGTGAEVLLPGTHITFAGHSTLYTVAARNAAAGGVYSDVSLYPALQTNVGDNTAVTVRAGRQNLAFHRDAIAFVSRPMMPIPGGFGSIVEAMSDPVSGITLRLEISREHKRVRWSFDLLYGVRMVRAELGTIIFG